MHGFSSMSSHIAIFLGLMALGVGYWVCIQARSDTQCPKWGKFLGIFISLVAVLGLLCVSYLTIKRCCLAKKDSWHQQMMGHPAIMEQMMGEPTEPSTMPPSEEEPK